MFIFFFFKQKTAYEIGTGDWSSDVCSSDLLYSEFSGNIDVQNKILESLSCQNCNSSEDTEETDRKSVV